MDVEGTDIPELPEVEKTRMEVARGQAAEIVDAAKTGDAEGFEAALSAMAQTARQVDMEAFLNSLHVPEDAGEWELGLRRILARIPDGWGRWISCGPGWYPLLVRLDEQLAAIFPDYEVHQAKEKFGGLRYYAGYPGVQKPADPEPEPSFPRKPQEKRTPEEQADFERYLDEHRAWRERYQAWSESDEAQALFAENERKVEVAEALIRAAEQEASATCELCGEPGRLMMTQAPSPWYQTLCPVHAEERGFVDQETYEAWWETVKDDYYAELKQRRIAQHVGKRILVCCEDERATLVVEATYARTAEAVEYHLEDVSVWDEVWFAYDDVGRRAVDIVGANYAEAAKRRKAEIDYQGGYFRLPGAVQTCTVGYRPPSERFTSVLHDHGVQISIPFADLYADEEAYEAYYQEQVARYKAEKKNEEAGS